MSLSPNQSPTALVILDGFGYTTELLGNAPAHAAMPTLAMFKKDYQWTLLHAAGADVGLLNGSVGNSEVGHLTIGAGRVTNSTLKRMQDAIDDGSFFTNKLLVKRFTQLKQSGKKLHLMGLLSDGGVHSQDAHLHALLELASSIGIKKVMIHPFLDGRDVPPQSAQYYLECLDDVCRKFEVGFIGSMHGRFYAMDRDHNAERTKISYDVLTVLSEVSHVSWQQALQASYDAGITDEFFYPRQLNQDACIEPGDGVVFFNTRPDRARQLTACFLTEAWSKLVFFITPIRYQDNFTNEVLFESIKLEHTLLDEISVQQPHAKLFTIAETEKYAHVTYFFRGMKEIKLPHETQVLVPSLKQRNYINQPAMSALTITQQVLDSLKKDPAYFYLINYANADMVGHSGDFQATVLACQSLDEQLKQLYQKIVIEQQGTLFVTADHGNAEAKIDLATGKPLTAHTANPVPFFAIGSRFKQYDQAVSLVPKKPHINYGLALVAPTILYYLGLTIPAEMEQEIIRF